jgi:ABC-type multidrug transport system permease subunit
LNRPLLLERILVLLKRQIKERIAYRMTLLLSSVSGIAGLLVYGLLGNTAVVSVTTQAYGMSLSSFLVSGVAFSSIITNGPGMFNQYAGSSQIEEVLVTPTGLREYVLSSSVLGILTSVGGAALFFIVSIFLFGLNYSYNLPAMFAVISLGLLSAIGLGFIGLGFQMVYKQTSILSWILFSLAGIAGNMLVPVQILPVALQTISYLTPQYYFFTGVRVALGSEVSSAASLLLFFGIYTIILLGLGLLALDYGVRFIRRNGTHRWV